MKNFLILLTITALVSCSNDDSSAPQVFPLADFSVSDRTVEIGSSVQFINESQNSTEYLWIFEGGNPSTSTEANPTVQYNNLGSFNVSLTATDGRNSSSQDIDDFINVVFSGIAPEASFSSSSTDIETFQSVSFMDESLNEPTTWEWTFPGGNPSSSTEQNPSVRYEQAGVFDVTLTVTNQAGTSTETRTDYVSVALREATYEVTFRGNWTVENHPIDFPENDHFSDAVGMIHNDSAFLFEEGEIASLGIQRVAEVGRNGRITDQINELIAQESAISFVNGGQLDTGDEQRTFTITVPENYPLVTLVSMIAPSPDWFIAVKNVSLFDGENFVETLTVESGVYDAGTDSGVTFTSPNLVTDPAEGVSLITTEPLGNGTNIDPPVAFFDFQIIN